MCVSPLYLHTTKKDSNTFNPRINRLFNCVPCGKCYECIQQRQSDYYVRILQEYEDTKLAGGYSIFFTLTYNNDHLPMLLGIPCFCSEDLSQFYKNLRRLEPDLKFRYFQSSEYGDKNHRPHYHLIFHVLSYTSLFKLKNLIISCWKKGFVYFGLNPVINSSLALKYVSKYVCKDFHVLGYLHSKGLYENPKSYSTYTKRGTVNYCFYNFHHSSIGYGSTLCKTLSDFDFIRGYFYRITSDKIRQKFIIPFYIKRKCLYDISYLYNGSPVYVYNDRFLSIYTRRLINRFNQFLLDFEVVQENADYFFSKSELSDNYLSVLVDFKQCDSNEFVKYILFYRGFGDLTGFNFDLVDDVNYFVSIYKTQFDFNPIPFYVSDFNVKDILFFDRIYNLFINLLITYKYEKYLQNTVTYRVNQIYRSFKSGVVKHQYVFSKSQFSNYLYKKIA